MIPINRRHFLSCATTLSVGLHARPATNSNPLIRVLDTRVISRLNNYYHGWPTLVRRREGELVLVCSGGREGHVCPFGRVEMMISKDGGANWSWPQVLLDGPLDDRDAGVVETSRGTLLVTTFTSLAYEGILRKAEQGAAGAPGAWEQPRLDAWRAAHGRLSAEQRKAELGQWMIRSTDGGMTWSARYSSLLNSPHGPNQLSDGRLLYAGRELWTGERRIGVCESDDDGASWRWLAQIPTRAGDDPDHYHELHAIETGDGRILVHIRNHNAANPNETLQSESEDSGRTWSPPYPIGVWGLPSFLLRLQNGTLLMTYGYRRRPFGIQARISRNSGESWSAPITITADGTSSDLGYPSTAELPDGVLLTVWYELMAGSPRAVLRQARWHLEV
jgi:sialidase-1